MGIGIRVAMELARDMPLLAGARVEGSAKYLGFVLGPLRQDGSFVKPLQKVTERAQLDISHIRYLRHVVRPRTRLAPG